MDQAFQEYTERLGQLQDALLEAYPDLYKRTDYNVNDFKGLSAAAISECEAVCQLLLEIEEGRDRSGFHPDKSGIGQYADLVKKLERENEFQKKLIDKLVQEVDLFKQIHRGTGGRPVPGNKLFQKYGHQSKQQAPAEQYLLIDQLEKEIKQLKAQYSPSKRAFSLDFDRRASSSSHMPRELGHTKSVSIERPPRAGSNDLGRSQLAINMRNVNRSQHFSPLPNKIHQTAMQTLSKEDLIQMVQSYQNQTESDYSEEVLTNRRLTSHRGNSTTASHTQHRANVKQASQLQSELKELEKRHFLVLKDFNKLQEERTKVLREKESIQIKVNVMERNLTDLTQNLLKIVETQKSSEDVGRLSRQVLELKETCRRKVQQVQERDLELAQRDREIRDLRGREEKALQQETQIEELKQMQLEKDSFQDTLSFNYQLVRSPRVNLQKVNKEVQCEEWSADQRYLVERYDYLKGEHHQLQKEYESAHFSVEDTKQSVEQLVRGVMDLKQVVVRAYLGKTNQRFESIGSNGKDDILYCNQVLRQIIEIVESNLGEGAESSSKMQLADLERSAEDLCREFKNAIDVKQVPNQLLTPLNNQQRFFEDLVAMFYKLKSECDLERVRTCIQKARVKTLKQHIETVAKAVADSSPQERLLDINQKQLTQILKLKKQLAFFNKENANYDSVDNHARTAASPQIIRQTYVSPMKGAESEHQAFSPLRERSQDRQRQSLMNSLSASKSPQQTAPNYTDKKLYYLNLKLKEAEKATEKNSGDLREKEFLIGSLREELERKNAQIRSLEGVLQEMNGKINEQGKYIGILETSCKESQQQYLIQSQKTVREHEQMMKSLNGKERELIEAMKRSQSVEGHTKESEQLQRSMQLLKSQYDREKKLVEEKVRQLTELQTSSAEEKALLQENQQLRGVNMQLNRVIQEERLQNEDSRSKMMASIQTLKEKILNIENGCAKELVQRLRALKMETTLRVDGKQSMSASQSETVEQMIKDVSGKVQQMQRQRENLQKAVNVLQSEKQQLFQQLAALQSSPRNPFQMNLMQTNITGSISRAYPVDQSLPTCMRTTSPQRMGSIGSGMPQQQHTLKSMVCNTLGMSDPGESNLYEYLSAEIVALRARKDELQSKNQHLMSAMKELESLNQKLDVLGKKENMDVYCSLVHSVREVLAGKKQESLLDDIISQPLKQKQGTGKQKQHAIDSSATDLDDSVAVYNSNSVRLAGDLEVLLPLIGKCFTLLHSEKEKLADANQQLMAQKEELASQRKADSEELMSKSEMDKLHRKKVEEHYKEELTFLRAEKDSIVSKYKDFAKNLGLLQKDNEQKAATIKRLKSELQGLKDETTLTEEQLRKTTAEKMEKEWDQRLTNAKEEAYFRGRKESTEEMVLENNKLRDIIESLRGEVSQKSKRLVEFQFEIEELQKFKKKSVVEVEELYQKMSREREGQKELQQRLDGLLQEVSYLKNYSRHHQQ